MKANRFSSIIVLRVALIALSCFALIWYVEQTNRLVSILFLVILLALQLASLIHYLNRVNRDLINFLVYLQEDDTTLAYSKKRVEKNFGNIIIDLDRIVKKLHQAGVEKAQQQHYINAIVEQVSVGLIAYTSTGKIDLVNRAAKELFGVNRTENISMLTHQYPELVEVFSSSSATAPTLVKLVKQGQLVHLAVKTNILRFSDEVITLVSFDDIRSELEAQEIDAWRKLIRILRHEIMNSITPILTLTTAIRRNFKRNGDTKAMELVSLENVNDALTSADVIEERSKALIAFVEKFKSLTNPPALTIGTFSVESCFQKIGTLYAKELKKRAIQLHIAVTPPTLQLAADEELVEQVVINLVKNSIEAISSSKGFIRLAAATRIDGKTAIQVTDSGGGIPPEYLDSIFVPSFTTKENGMGIGLSLSKQIMQLHQGTISVSSNGGTTTFELIF